MYGNRNFQNAKMDLHGRRSDSGLDFQPKSERAYRGGSHACADTKFQDFITTTRPADRPCQVTGLEIWIFILKYTKNPYENIFLNTYFSTATSVLRFWRGIALFEGKMQFSPDV